MYYVYEIVGRAAAAAARNAHPGVVGGAYIISSGE